MKKINLRRRHNYIVVFLLFLGLCFILFFYTKKDYSSNKKFINNMLNYSNYYFNSKKEKNNYNISKYPIKIIDTVLAYKSPNDTKYKYIVNNIQPRVYIYNTHPLEAYLDKKIDTNVVYAAKLLKDKLNKIGINTTYEEKNATKYLKEHNLTFNESYQATRKFLTEKLKTNQFDLIIDLHRDALARKNSVVSINGKKYAKIMFVQNVYFENYKYAQELNNIVEKKYPNLSRGIYDKYVSKFNQDLNKNAILIELGSNNNYYEEILNSIDALVDCIGEFLNE